MKDLTQPFLNLSKTTSVSEISNAAGMTFVSTRPPQKTTKNAKSENLNDCGNFCQKNKKG